MQDADRHERAAREHEQAAAAADNRLSKDHFDCGDPVMNDQITTGGQRVMTWQPCFDIADEAAENHRGAAQQERQLARKDRATAARLVDTQRFACAGIPEREQGHSVFSHVRSIDRVEPVYNGDRLAGVRIEFKPVRGLTADWLRRDVECHRARWAALGKDPAWMPMDPTLVDSATIDVRDAGSTVIVVVTSPEREQAANALARARGQLAQTARR